MEGVRQQLSRLLQHTTKRRDHASFATGLPAIDQLLSSQRFTIGAIHEVLVESARFSPLAFLILLARSASIKTKSIAWLDPRNEIYPPGLLAAELPIDRLLLLRPSPADLIRVMAECCRCKGIGATVATIARMNQVEARRLQLAVERGGGIGLLVRTQQSAIHYAAATRWLVSPQRGDKQNRRWKVQLIHGHGGHIGQSAILEVCRETNRMRAFTPVADRSTSPQILPISA
jgi:hypothetical protein